MDLTPVDPESLGDELPQSLQERLDEYNKNFERLNELVGDGSLIERSANRELRVEDTKDVLSQALPVGVQSIIQLAAFALSENVRLNAAKFLVLINLGKDPAIKAEDPVKDLIERLRKPVTDED